MKIKQILALSFSLLIIGCSSFGATAERRNAHHQAHARLQAKNVSPVEQQMVASLKQQEILKREHDLSPESSRMLDDLIIEARKHLGKPYVWSAKGPNAFDCSGFTSYVYKQFGYNISPGSRIQSTQGSPVNAHDLRKGDLVFFTSPRSGRNVGHVGIVVSANNETGTFKFIHASQKGIAIQDFAGGYVKRFLFARRVITE